MEKEALITQFLNTIKPIDFEPKDNFFFSGSNQRLLFFLEETFRRSQKPNLTEIANYLNISKAALSKKIKHLENRRLVKRYFEKNDRKNAYLKLTPEGEIIYQKIYGFLNKTIETIVSEIGMDDSIKLLELMQKCKQIIESAMRGENNA